MLLQNSTHFRTSRSSLHTYHMASGPLAVSFGVLHIGYAASDHVTLSRVFPERFRLRYGEQAWLAH